MKTIYGGMMSGTSLDGLDGVLVDLGEPRPTMIAAQHHRWPQSVAQSLLGAASGSKLTMAEVLWLSQEVSEAHVRLGRALLETVDKASIAAIGMHGQTVWHQPPTPSHLGYTLQLGSAAWVAATLDVPVVGDFRTADMALGGQGAPLAPYAHQRLFAHPAESRAVLNLGGIANLTGLMPGRPIWASDIGPGNMLLDDLARHFSGGTLAYDPEGAHARRGQNHPQLLAQLLEDDFFALPFPKSTGRERFGGEFAQILHPLSWEDASCTAGHLTLEGVRRALAALPDRPIRLIVAGGGAHNPWLLEQLTASLSPVRVQASTDYGIAPLQLEAIAFAMLAQARQEGHYANLPSVTGARAPTLLGSVARGPGLTSTRSQDGMKAPDSGGS